MKIGLLCRLASVIVLAAFVGSCSFTRDLPETSAMNDRLGVFPTAGLALQRPVTIYWNEYQVPFIEAETDTDLAYALGMVHAHLRLAQMDLLRRIAQGRISEMVGPVATEIDHSLRILNYPRAAEVMERNLAPESRAWLDAFVAGVNHYQSSIETLPHEFYVLDISPEPWTVRDVLTIGRLAGTDVNWLAWFRFLQLSDREDWPRLWRDFLRNGGDSIPSFAADGTLRNLENILGGSSRSGSNSVAVAGSRTDTGAALIANDPHLGIQFPNLWLIVGIKSPSDHAVGLMVPGIPFIAVGRNERIAWGGTNMRAASSDLYDVSHLPPEAFTRRTERIGVRWWFDRTVVVRDTEYGPVLSDAPLLGGDGRSFALRWVGHETGDEITALLRAQRAGNWQEFRAAFESFAVSAQNMIYADVDGNIGQLMATQLPIRRNGATPQDFILDPRDARNLWAGFADVSDLPMTYNPEAGYVASANNRPTEAEIPIGYIFSPNDRIIRLHQLLRGTGEVDGADMRALQQDVYQTSSVALRDAYLRHLDEVALADLSDAARAALDLMRAWDGHYRPASRGPVALEAFHGAFLERFYLRRFPDEAERAAYTGAGRIRLMVIEDLAEADRQELAEDLRAAAEAAGRTAAEFESWGEMHRLGLAHPLAFVPLIGGRYRFGDHPVGGSTDTLMKTAHRTGGERHFTVYGQNARHISDMSHPDENYFVLLGGQDGWIGSENSLDQAELWLRGRYIRMPMQLDVIQSEFRFQMRLIPTTN